MKMPDGMRRFWRVVKSLPFTFTVFCLLFAALIAYNAWRQNADVLAIGTFVVLTLTLIVLVWYARDTNSIARATLERWQREGVLSTTYSMEIVGKPGDAGRTMFRLHNPSPLVVSAKVACNFQLYGEPVDYHPLYDGKQNWLIFPQQVSIGWFEIAGLLAKKGKSVTDMIAEHTMDNFESQLTMLLELEFWDELGVHRELPARSHYFDFVRWNWIPQLAEGRMPTERNRLD